MSIWFPVAPMLATASARIPVGDDWAFEVKWDGFRALAFIERGSVRLQSRSGLDITQSYPQAVESLGEHAYASTLVLDGELVAFDESDRPSFAALQRGRPASFYAFDVLRVDTHDTVSLGYLERRRLLADVVGSGPNLAIPEHRIGGGEDLAAATRADGLEGVVAKRVDSTYQVGGRSTSWRKIKNRTTMVVTVGGYTVGSGARAATLRAVLVGSPAADGGGLRFRGAIGTGFDEPTLIELRSVLDNLETDVCPFEPAPTLEPRREPRWVQPMLEMVVSMSGLTDDGHIRHGSFVGWHAPNADPH